MISNQTIQECLDDIKEVLHAPLAVFGTDGSLVAENMDSMDGLDEAIEYFMESPADSQQMKGHHFFKLYDEDEMLYIIAAGAPGPEGYSAGRLAAGQIGRLVEAYKEKFSVNQFMQEILQDHLLKADIYNRSKQLGLDTGVARGVFLIETEHKQDDAVMEMVRELYGKSSRACVTAVDEDDIILIRELGHGEQEQEDIARTLVDMVNVEAMSKVRVSYGNPASDIRELSEAYREAKMALEVGRIFYSSRPIVSYNVLGIGRLIYQLPPKLCDMFLDEVFGGKENWKPDEEMLATINRFFEMNLNLSETARQMNMHRNTLSYRLEKIQKMTGLDIRSFEDAMTFKLALMVADYRRMAQK